MLPAELIKKLKKDGWEVDRINGSHYIMKKVSETVSIPVHNKDMGAGLLNKILKKTGLK